MCIFLINNYALYFLPFHNSFKAVWFFCNFLVIPQFITLITWYCWQKFLTYCSSIFPDVEKHIPLHRFLWDFILSSVKTALLFLPLISYTLSSFFFFFFWYYLLSHPKADYFLKYPDQKVKHMVNYFILFNPGIIINQIYMWNILLILSWCQHPDNKTCSEFGLL